KIKGEFVPALELAKSKLAEVRDATMGLQKEFAKGLKLPDFATESIEKRLNELKELEAKWLKKIKDAEEKASAALDGTDGAAGVDGAPGITGPDGAVGKVGFVGLKEAWSNLAQSMQPKDKTQESILKEVVEQNKNLETINSSVQSIDVGMDG
ncbi:hypothetical protein LCGC14_1793120, partial [marine sediment metagenome]